VLAFAPEMPESSVVVRVPADYTTGPCVRGIAAFAAITLERADGDIAELVRSRACRRPARARCARPREGLQARVTGRGLQQWLVTRASTRAPRCPFPNTYWTLVQSPRAPASSSAGDLSPARYWVKSHLIMSEPQRRVAQARTKRVDAVAFNASLNV